MKNTVNRALVAKKPIITFALTALIDLADIKSKSALHFWN